MAYFCYISQKYREKFMKKWGKPCATSPKLCKAFLSMDWNVFGSFWSQKYFLLTFSFKITVFESFWAKMTQIHWFWRNNVSKNICDPIMSQKGSSPSAGMPCKVLGGRSRFFRLFNKFFSIFLDYIAKISHFWTL